MNLDFAAKQLLTFLAGSARVNEIAFASPPPGPVHRLEPDSCQAEVVLRVKGIEYRIGIIASPTRRELRPLLEALMKGPWS